MLYKEQQYLHKEEVGSNIYRTFTPESAVSVVCVPSNLKVILKSKHS